MKGRSLVLAVAFALLAGERAGADSIDPNCVTQEEMNLYEALMAHRADMGLARVPLSGALTRVAKMHTIDLLEHPGVGNPSHDWSTCRIDQSWNCMWDKPKTMAGFLGSGYEISFGGSGGTWSPQQVLEGWKASSAHNAVIVEEGMWEKSRWQSVGVSLAKQGEQTNSNGWWASEADPGGPPPLCGAGGAWESSPVPPPVEEPPLDDTPQNRQQPQSNQQMGRWIKIVNNFPSTIRLHVEVETPRGEDWIWIGPFDYTFKANQTGFLSQGSKRLYGRTMKVWAEALDNSGVWYRDKDIPTSLGDPYEGETSAYTYTFDPPEGPREPTPAKGTRKNQRYLKVLNQSGVDIVVYAQYKTVKAGNWLWMGPMKWRFKAGKNAYLLKDGQRITARYLNIWAESEDGAKTWKRDKEGNLDAGGDYAGPTETYTYTFNP